MIVVVNTTPLISLACIGQLDLLKKLFGQIIIAEAVYQEIKAKQSFAYNQIDNDWITVKTIQGQLYKQILLAQLDAGEAETIILAKEMNADFVIIDENLGYRSAINAGLTAIRTLSILLRAKEKGYILSLKPLLDGMITQGRWYSNAVYLSCLQQAGEQE